MNAPPSRPTFEIEPLRSFSIVRHQSVEQIADLLGSHAPGPDARGNFRTLGFFGFADTDTRTLHFWVDADRANPSLLVKFFAHEIAHLEFHPAGELSVAERAMAEKEAMLIGAIAQQALCFTRGVLGEDPSMTVLT